MPRTSKSLSSNVKLVVKITLVTAGAISSFITIGTFAANTYNSLVAQQFYDKHETAYRVVNFGFESPENWKIRCIVFLVIAVVSSIIYFWMSKKEKKKGKR